MLFLLVCFFAFSSSRCITREEGLYLGMCENYVTYPIYVNDNVSSINSNNNFVIQTWMNQMVPMIKYVDLVPIQCALKYPTCINGLPSRICRSNCSAALSGGLGYLYYNPCNTIIFYDDSLNDGSMCTTVLASDASRLFISMMVLVSVLFIMI